MIFGLGGNDLLLNGCQQQLRLGQAQPEVGDIAKVIRLRDFDHIRPLTFATSARFHQPHNPSHPRHPP